MAEFSDFQKIDIRVGRITGAELNVKARKPAYTLSIDFGPEIGEKHSSAQIVDLYTIDQLIGKTVVGVVNFPPRNIAGVESQVLVLGAYSGQGVVLLEPGLPVELGDKIG